MFMVTCVAMSVAGLPCLAQNSAPAPTPAPQVAPAESSIQGFGDRDQACLAWTDMCHTCARGEGNTITCSNIGIACQPSAVTCSSRRSEPPK